MIRPGRRFVERSGEREAAGAPGRRRIFYDGTRRVPDERDGEERRATHRGSGTVRERLRGLPPRIGFLARVAGLFLAFLAALTVGAGFAVVVGWSQNPAALTAVAPDDLSPSEGATPQNTATTNGARETTAGTEEPGPGRPDAEASFLHRATDANSRGDYTYLTNPRMDGDPDAVVLVEFAPGEGDAGADAYGHNVGVWYEPVAGKWAVFNQDLAPVPAGTAFRVTVPPASGRFVHRFDAPDGDPTNDTYIDDPSVNGRPEADISVTQNWNPGGGVGVYNDHPVGVRYDSARGRWQIFNQDLAPIRDGSAFNVGVADSTTDEGPPNLQPDLPVSLIGVLTNG